MSESTGAPGSVSPATRPDGPAPQRVPAGVRMSRGAEDFLSFYMRAHCNLHRPAALGGAGVRGRFFRAGPRATHSTAGTAHTLDDVTWWQVSLCS